MELFLDQSLYKLISEPIWFNRDELSKKPKLISILRVLNIYITNKILHVSISCCCLTVQKNENIGYWWGASLATIKQCKKRSLNDPNTFLLINQAKYWRAVKYENMFTILSIEIFVPVSYFVYGAFLAVMHVSRQGKINP